LLAAEAGERAAKLTTLFEDEGYEVVVVRDGFELMNAWTFAWLASGEQPFAVIVTDGPLSLLSGPEAVLELRQFSGCRAICVLAGSDAGQDPWSVERIVSEVRWALSPSRRRRPA
jgi:CheY-like chemotaxis protein